MALRLENRKLETALLALSKPESNEEKSGKNVLVVALPMGEAQERIDSLLAENGTLLNEILQLRSSPDPAVSKKELRRLRGDLNEKEAELSALKLAHVHERDMFDTEQHESKLTIARLERENEVLNRQIGLI